MTLFKSIKYNREETIQVINGEQKVKKGYVSRVDNLDGTLLIVDVIPETEKFRVSPDDAKMINTNFSVYGYDKMDWEHSIWIKEKIK